MNWFLYDTDLCHERVNATAEAFLAFLKTRLPACFRRYCQAVRKLLLVKTYHTQKNHTKSTFTKTIELFGKTAALSFVTSKNLTIVTISLYICSNTSENIKIAFLANLLMLSSE